ncbi:PQQ-binding-like beta-propeller repeat protein [Catenovulum sp. SM1970]|uniref:outer membrane protein assembly factor BamB family protein n=1 Tax=Marinifaba aquimaris TaxID=2741323 RepID=UPI0015737D74|nr:PQQ-binding-like beta-propeller repeat protein [Marinifaba aquimaris]NTS76011.1 PQQ-binding-like beta-propeller repeat protein [Marinifaba aquimaris]
MTKQLWIFGLAIGLSACGGGSGDASPSIGSKPLTSSEIKQRVEQQEQTIRSQSLWFIDTGAPIHATAAVADNKVFIGNDEGNLFALATDTGEIIWQLAIGSNISGDIVAHNDSIIFLTEGAELIALNIHDGSDVWRLDTRAERILDTWDYHNNHPLIVNNELYLVSKSGYVMAINPNTGELLWEKNIGERLLGRPALYDNTLSFASETGLYNFDINRKEINWYNDTTGYSSSPAVAEGVVITGSRNAYAQAVDLQTGENVWDVQHGGNWVTGEAIYHQGNFYIGTSDDHLLESINAKTGEVNWNIDAGGNVFARPVIYQDKVLITAGSAYVDQSKGYLTVVDFSGEVHWQLEATNFLNTVTVEQGVIYTGNESGYFYALPLE